MLSSLNWGLRTENNLPQSCDDHLEVQHLLSFSFSNFKNHDQYKMNFCQTVILKLYMILKEYARDGSGGGC